MTENVKVTVILTSYNHEGSIQEAIDSVLNQTFKDFELIIWDDASTDNSWDIIQSYTDSRIRSFRNEKNLGAGNLKRAIAKVKSRLIAVHHSDDSWELDKLEKQVAYLEQNLDVGAVFTWANIIDEDGMPFKDKNHLYYGIFDQPNRTRYEWLNHFFYHGNALCHPSVLIRKDVYDDVGMYPNGMALMQDFDMWLRVLLRYEIHVIPERLVRFRVHKNEANSSGNRPENRVRGQFEYLQLLNNYRSIGSFQELVKVFPEEASPFARNGHEDVDYVLGMIAVNADLPHMFVKLFGLTLLFEVINDLERAKNIKEIYGFSRRDFLALSAKYDVFSIEAIIDLHERIRNLESLLDEIQNSKAWRLVEFLRRIRAFFVPSGSLRAKVLGLFLLVTSKFVAFLINLPQKIRIYIRHIILLIRNRRLLWFLQRFFEKSYRYFVRFKKKQVLQLPPQSEEKVYVPLDETLSAPESLSAKLIAFYLPQYHPIPENDAWWGKGFTEWTNVSKAIPNFVGHYQPKLPGELGFYDLRLPEIQQRQVELAKLYGVSGFAFYYYWFAGKTLLEYPIRQYHENPNFDLPFCLCWANENWTRTWDGLENDILIAQEYTEDAYLSFIQDISQYFKDPRYIRIDNKPVLLVYRVDQLPDAQKAAALWREESRRQGFDDLYLVVVQSFGVGDPRPFGFDAAVEFPPHHLGDAHIPQPTIEFLNPDFKGEIYDYSLAVKQMLAKKHGDYTVFRSVMPAWDNTARKQNTGHAFVNSSPTKYQAWLQEVIRETQHSLPTEERYIFVNAWNEWAEGTYLEPDRKYGYAYLQATRNALTSHDNQSSWTVLFVSQNAHRGGSQEVLINLMVWFHEHTDVRLKLLCLEGGEWLSRFEKISDTILLSRLYAEYPDNGIADALVDFCEGRPNLIYVNSVASGRTHSMLSDIDAPILTHFHELESSIEKYGGDWVYDIVSTSSHFIACSGAVKENLITSYDISEDKISLVHSSIISQQNYVLSKKEKIIQRIKLGLKTKKTLLFGCGLGMPFRKGADLFIALGKELLARGYDNFHLYWVGDFDINYQDVQNGAWKVHFEQLRKNKLRKYITFLGIKKNPREYLSAGDIFILPSREDPFPLVALEAADCGLPVLCFDGAGGMPDFVEDDAGYVVPYEDVSAMADKVGLLLGDGNLRDKLGARAKEKLLDKYIVERTSPHIFSVCRQVAGRKPKVSVIVPNYNHAPYLQERLDSIFNQSYRDFEVILLDDASSDNSLDILEQYQNCADVKLVVNRKNTGSPFVQWLAGIDLARGDIFWIAESDDLCSPDFLEKLIPAFDDPQVKLAYTNSNIIDENSTIVGDYLCTEYLLSLSSTKWSNNYELPAEDEINVALGIKNTILNISAVLIRRFDISEELRKRLSNLRIAGDWYFIVHAIRNGSVHYLAEKLNNHRRHPESVIARTIDEKKIREFFGEVHQVQEYVFKTYTLDAEFSQKWEEYLRSQWNSFVKDKDFDKISEYYPFKEMKALLMSTGKKPK